MKQVALWVLVFAAAFAMSATPKVMRKTVAFKEGPVEVRREAEYPVAIDGWSYADLEALWKAIDLLVEDEAMSEWSLVHHLPSHQAFLEIAKKLRENKNASGQTEQALASITSLKVPFANRDWAALALDGYHNEGGNGCHSDGEWMLYERETGWTMCLSWFAKDEEALQKLVIAHLEQALIKKDKEGKSPFDGKDFTKAKAEAAEPQFLPAPEGIRFRYGAYGILPGCFGLPEVTVPWEALAPVCKPECLAQLKALVTP